MDSLPITQTTLRKHCRWCKL